MGAVEPYAKSDGIFSAVARVVMSAFNKLPGKSSLLLHLSDAFVCFPFRDGKSKRCPGALNAVRGAAVAAVVVVVSLMPGGFPSLWLRGHVWLRSLSIF